MLRNSLLSLSLERHMSGHFSGARCKGLIMTNENEIDEGAAARHENDAHERAWQVDARESWNAHDVWLTRVRQPRELAARLASDVSAIQSSQKAR
jgi:hypothetical protein